MVEMKTAWALGLDYGCEGQQPPLTLFTNKAEAEAAKELMTSGNGTGTYLVEVPFWPEMKRGNNEPHT